MGKAVFYSSGVMEATAQYREISLDNYLDGVALMSCRHIGETVWLAHHMRWEGPYVVVDCPRKGDAYSAVVYTEEVVEVGFKTAKRWGMVSQYGKVSEWYKDVVMFICDEPPDRLYSSVDTVVYRDWWLDTVEYTRRWEKSPLYYPPDRWKMPDGTFVEGGVYCD
jgi:hypothetical protein